jgi:glycosyltransferase involved in cell wall biosynthesis
MRNNSKKANIICFSNQLWDFPLWTNKKHVMTRLSEQGFNVLFVDPPINTGRLFLRHLMAGRWSLKRLLSWVYTDRQITVFSPLNFVPSNPELSKYFAKRINKLAARKFDPTLKTILWVYNVEIDNLFDIIDSVKHDVLVYDCVDNYPAFPKYANNIRKKNQIIRQEEMLAKRADIVFASAPGLVDKLSRLNSKTFYTPNVGDYPRFNNVKELSKNIPEDVASIPHPRIGFSGAIDDYKFDKELVRKLVHDYPNYSFILIGLSGLKDREGTLKELGLDNATNVYFMGMRKYTDLPYYFAAFDVFIIPYVLNDYTVGGCFPVKFHDALAAGLPVVVTDLPAYKPFADISYISKSHNDFSQNIRRALEQDSDQIKTQRQQIAKENSWEGKVKKMIELIDTEAKPL